jgi:uroporphyrinogen decarboxylase
MTSRERVLAALAHRPTDRVPRFEIWIDALLKELVGVPTGPADPADVYVALGQDCVMMPTRPLPGSNAWRTGVDEWGRIWREGTYVGGMVDDRDDLERYSPPLDDARLRYDADRVRQVRERYPDHCLIFGTHIGPFTAAYMAMGFERFFTRLFDDPAFVHRLLDARTAWCIAVYREALRLGAEVLVLGDDAGHTQGPMLSPPMWRAFVLPYHRRIVAALDAPVIWHSDGAIVPLLPMAIEAGFAGVHGLDPIAGVDLAEVQRAYRRDLALVGNVDVRVLCGDDPDAVRAEVDRCLIQGTAGAGGYMLASCNSIFAGMNARAVGEFFRYAEARVLSRT